MRVPGRLAVIVGVDIDEARRDQQPLGVDLLAASSSDHTDGGDLAVLDGDVRFARAGARAVRHRAAAHDQIVFRHCSLPGLAEV